MAPGTLPRSRPRGNLPAALTTPPSRASVSGVSAGLESVGRSHAPGTHKPSVLVSGSTGTPREVRRIAQGHASERARWSPSFSRSLPFPVLADFRRGTRGNGARVTCRPRFPPEAGWGALPCGGSRPAGYACGAGALLDHGIKPARGFQEHFIENEFQFY